MTDATGANAAAYSYAAFGATRTSAGGLANEIRFTGERTDAESGLEFLRARTYDPTTGTFLQRDSWGISPLNGQSIDPYAYTQNDPADQVDPTGHNGRLIDYGSPSTTLAGISAGCGMGQLPPSYCASSVHNGPSTTSFTLTPPAPAKKPASQPGGGCSFGPICGFTNWVGDSAQSLQNDPIGTVGRQPGDAYSHTLGGLVNNGADALASAGVHYSSTIGVCAGWSGTLGHYSGVAGGCIMASTNGQIGVSLTGAGGGGFGVQGGAFVAPMLSTGGDIYDQSGVFNVPMFTVKIGPGIHVEVPFGTGHCGQPVGNLQIGLAAGGGAAAGDAWAETAVLWSSKPASKC